MLGGDPSKARRLAGARNDLAALDAALAAARAEYARVAQRNKQVSRQAVCVHAGVHVRVFATSVLCIVCCVCVCLP